MENYCNFKPFDKVLVRYDNQHVWQIDFFSHYVRGVECPYKCLTRDFNQCIPYEGHEHLIDTTSEPSLPKQTEQSQTQTKENKMEEDCDNYGYPVEYFKRNDVVLCRDADDEECRITSFVAKGSEQYPFQCLFYRWKNCIPYEGNEHLLGTTDNPERCNPDKDTLFGIKLKPGYVLEFEDDEIGILFPTANGFAVSYAKGLWQFLKGIKKDSIVRILGITQTDYLRSGELLWEKPKKQTFTKAEIAERLDMNVQDFEIIDEDNEENE
mgnify:FL=1